MGPLINDDRPLLTLSQVARELNRSLSQVRRYVGEEKLPAHKLGMRWFVDRWDLRAFTLGRQGALREEVLVRARALRQSIGDRVGQVDVIDLVDKSRRSHL